MLRSIKWGLLWLLFSTLAQAQDLQPPNCSISGGTITCGANSLTPATSPGGSDTQLQYNNAGSFGGTSQWTYNNSTGALTGALGTITTNRPFTLSETWNAAGINFSAATTTISNSASNTLSTFWQMQKDGYVRGGFLKSGQLMIQADRSTATSCGYGASDSYGAASLMFPPNDGGCLGGVVDPNLRPKSSIAWVHDVAGGMPYALQSYFTHRGEYFTGLFMTISNKRWDINGQIQISCSAVDDGSEPSMFCVSGDVNGPGIAIESGIYSGGNINESAIAIYDKTQSLGPGGVTPYSAGWHKKSGVIDGQMGSYWGSNLIESPYVLYEASLTRSISESTAKGLAITGNALSSLLDFNSTNTTSTTRNWRLATNKGLVGALQIYSSPTVGISPSTLRATFSPTGPFYVETQGDATTAAVGLTSGAYGLSQPVSGKMGFVINNTQAFAMSALTIFSPSNGGYAWTSGVSTGTSDSSISRNAPGILQIGTGTFGAGGSLLLTHITSTGTITAANLTATTLATDAGKTDASVCVDTTTGVFYKGSGAIGVCLGTSSMRYKHDIIPQKDGLDQLIALAPKNYRYNKGYIDDGEKEQYGFLAEDVVKVLPKLVGLDKDGKPNTVDIVGMIPILVKSIQQQQIEIDTLKRRLN